MPNWRRLPAQYVSAPVGPEQPCVMTTAGTRPVPSGSLRTPKIVAGVPSSGAAMKGGVNRLPGNVRLWKLTISIWSWAEASRGVINTVAPTAAAQSECSTDDLRVEAPTTGIRHRCASEAKGHEMRKSCRSPMNSRRINHLPQYISNDRYRAGRRVAPTGQNNSTLPHSYCSRTGRLSGPRKPKPCQRTPAGSGKVMLGKRSNSMGSRMTPTVRRDRCAPAQ